MRTNIILSPWSSGSTAITGYLDRMGSYTCPPHVRTNDDRTPVSYEPRELQQHMLQYFDEITLQPKSSSHAEKFKEFFGIWDEKVKLEATHLGLTSLTLKQPLLAFYIDCLLEIGDVRFFIVQRPLEKIEATRLRRNWAPNYGIAGAQVIYNSCFNMAIKHSIPMEIIPFDKFKADGKYRLELVSRFGITLDSQKISEAENWLRN